jgi:hypothetical protein
MNGLILINPVIPQTSSVCFLAIGRYHLSTISSFNFSFYFIFGSPFSPGSCMWRQPMSPGIEVMRDNFIIPLLLSSSLYISIISPLSLSPTTPPKQPIPYPLPKSPSVHPSIIPPSITSFPIQSNPDTYPTNYLYSVTYYTYPKTRTSILIISQASFGFLKGAGAGGGLPIDERGFYSVDV